MKSIEEVRLEAVVHVAFAVGIRTLEEYLSSRGLRSLKRSLDAEGGLSETRYLTAVAANIKADRKLSGALRRKLVKLVSDHLISVGVQFSQLGEELLAKGEAEEASEVDSEKG